MWPFLRPAQQSWFTETLLRGCAWRFLLALPWVSSRPSAAGGFQAGLSCLSIAGVISLPSAAQCLVLFHSLWSLSCACCCVSTSQLGSCQDKPAREPFDSCQLPRVSGWCGISLPRGESGSENEKAPVLCLFCCCTLSPGTYRVVSQGSMVEGFLEFDLSYEYCLRNQLNDLGRVA